MKTRQLLPFFYFNYKIKCFCIFSIVDFGDQSHRNNGNENEDDKDLAEPICQPVINEVKVANIIADVNDANVIDAVDAVVADSDESAKNLVKDASNDDVIRQPPVMGPADNVEEIAKGSDDDEAKALKPYVESKDIDVDKIIDSVKIRKDSETENIHKPTDDKSAIAKSSNVSKIIIF